MFATFDLAIAEAAKAAPEAERLMSLLAFFAPDAIPLELVTDAVMPVLERGEAVAALSEVSLLRLDAEAEGGAAASVHPLVQEVARGRLDTNEAAETAAIAVKLLTTAFPQGNDSGDVRFWPQCARLLPHALAVLNKVPQTGKDSETTTLLMALAAHHLQSRADYAAAEPLMRRALEINEASYGPDHPEVAANLNNLAALLQDTNRLDEAEPLMRRAVEILDKFERATGYQHPHAEVFRNNLAILLAQMPGGETPPPQPEQRGLLRRLFRRA